LCEVIGLALAEQLDDRSPAQPLLLAAAIDEIRTSLSDPDLSPMTVAERLAISVRTLHGAFRHHDTTFSQEVLRQRLALARQLLLDPGRRGLRVVDIAAEAGFADRSHFHRAFRAATGLTPTTYRTMYGHKPSFR
jgi:AraC-like DNA-binding protein